MSTRRNNGYRPQFFFVVNCNFLFIVDIDTILSQPGLTEPTLTIADAAVFKVTIPATGTLDTAAAATEATSIKSGVVVASSDTKTFNPDLPVPLLNNLDNTKLNTQLTTKVTSTDTAGNTKEQDVVIKILGEILKT